MSLSHNIFARLFPTLAPDNGGIIVDNWGGQSDTPPDTPPVSTVPTYTPQANDASTQTINYPQAQVDTMPVQPDNPPSDVPPVTGTQPQIDTSLPSGLAAPVINPRAFEKKHGGMAKPTWAELHPHYQDPYLNPQNEGQYTANLIARKQEDVDNPQNQDFGVKGRIKEIVQNFLFGLAHTPEGANWKQALVLGAAGAGGGAFNRKWNEQRQAEQDLPALYARQKFNTDQADAEAKRKLQISQANYYDQRPEIENNRIKGLNTRALQRTFVNLFDKASGRIDLTDPVNEAFVNGAKAEGITFPTVMPKTITKFRPDHETGQMYAEQSDETGKTHIVQLLKDDGTPWIVKTPQMLTEEEKADDRTLRKQLADDKNVTAIKVANINAGSRKDVANINQGGALQRLGITDKSHVITTLAEIAKSPPAAGERPDNYAKRIALSQKNLVDAWNTEHPKSPIAMPVAPPPPAPVQPVQPTQ